MEQLTHDLIIELQKIQQKLSTGETLTTEDTQALLIHLMAQEEK